MSNSAENTLFHCGTFPYSLPKAERYRLYITGAIPYLNTLPAYLYTLTNLDTTLIHCRNYTLSKYVEKFTAENIANLNTLRKIPIVAQNRFFVNQSRARKTLKPRQPIRIEYHSAEKNPNALGSGMRPFSARRHESAAIAFLNTWRVFHPLPRDQLTLLLLI